MTLIAYCNKTLYADAKMVVSSKEETNNHVCKEHQKLYTTECNRVAYAGVGIVLDSRERGILEILLVKHFQKDPVGVGSIFLSKDITSFFLGKEDTVIVMTSRNVYELTENIGARLHFEHDISFGSGQYLFDFANAVTPGVKTVDKVKKIYENISKVSNFSGPVHNYVKMSSLTSFI